MSRSNGKGTTLVHCVIGVKNKVEKNLFYSSWINSYPRHGWFKVPYYLESLCVGTVFRIRQDLLNQFVHIGGYAFISGLSGVPKDVPPYVIAAGPRIKLHGLNIVGLKRHGFSDNTISLLKKTYRLIFRIGLTLTEAIARVRAEVDQVPEVVAFIDFITSSERGITR